MYNNATEPDYAVLVGVGLNEIIDESNLDELADLCRTCNIETVKRVVQNLHAVDVTYFIGSGKVDEIAEIVKNTNATVVVFDVELSGSKVRNLEDKFGVPVLDRSKVILDIFATRAKSAEGKLQVELAQLKYNLPRLIGSNGRLAKMRNSVGMRGPGEKKLELDKRKIRDEILFLERKLAEVKKVREVGRKSTGAKPRVCLVGYTNSGKSTLLNTITKAGVYAKDELFATLDTTTRSVYLGGGTTDNVGGVSGAANNANSNTPNNAAAATEGNISGTNNANSGTAGGVSGAADNAAANTGTTNNANSNTTNNAPQSILLTDTVGFINKLPHEFIRAFESTLLETRDADLLLHIVDCANPECEKQIAVVNEVLKNIGADKIPQILVYNKIDRGIAVENKNAVHISALKNIGIDKLKAAIVKTLDNSKI
ncbi:MAG: GTPase HflX [Christensenellaceae bacterium]|jgi:50S ribosomal subunit-associated GTPase HflX|nr:GTPase HflX [Christensenellaceae bacterium]